MVFRMTFKVSPVASNRHLINRQPAVFRFAKVSQESYFIFCNKINNSVEPRIINHNKFPLFIPQGHAYIFPYLNGYSTTIERIFKIAEYSLFPSRFIPVVYGKSARIIKFSGKFFTLVEGHLLLFF